MKNFLSLILFSLLISGVVSAQSLSLEWEDVVVADGTEILIEGDGSEDEYIANMLVRNNTSGDLAVKLRRETLEMPDGTQNFICWGSCFGPGVDESPNSVTIGANATSVEWEFGGHYMPKMEYEDPAVFGTARVKYTFFVEGNEADNVSFIAKFEILNVPALSLEWEDVVVADGTEILIEGDGSEDEYIANMLVRNNTSGDLAVKLRRETLEMPDGTQNFICWGSCFGPGVDESPNSVTIGANATSVEWEFGGHYMPKMEYEDPFVPGTARIKYIFFVEGNEADNVSFIAKFHISGVSVDEIAEKVVFSNAYPNPANTIVSIDYDLNSINMPAQVAVYNMLGQNVINQNIENNAGKLQFSVADLNEGIYFYSIIVGSQTVETKKLLVRK